MHSTEDSSQTIESFGQKWANNADLAFASTLNSNSEICQWILTRNGFKSLNDLNLWLGKNTRVLDAGCGNGRVSALFSNCLDSTSKIVSIDINPEIAKVNLAQYLNVSVEYGDLTKNLNSFGLFDRIYCQEVLHHTSDPQNSFSNLCRQLAPNGEIAIYVYRKKAPIREFTDDFIRNKISHLSWKDAEIEMTQITRLAKILTDLEITINVPQIESLDIIEGEYTIQRFFYHFFMKAFWSPEISFGENVAINGDWYHPQISTRHTLDEVKQWFKENKLEITHEFEDFYGITVHGKAISI